jgi:hypothetical protein
MRLSAEEVKVTVYRRGAVFFSTAEGSFPEVFTLGDLQKFQRAFPTSDGYEIAVVSTGKTSYYQHANPLD